MVYIVNKTGSEILVNTQTEDSRSDAVVTGLPGGGFAVAWSHEVEYLEYQVKLQLFDAAGAKLGPERVVLAQAEGGNRPAIAVLADGRLVLTFDARNIAQSGDSRGIAGKILSVDTATGALTAVSDLAVNQQLNGSQVHSELVALANGDFAVVWGDQDRAVGGSDMNGYADLVGSIYSSDGVRRRGEFPVNFSTSEDQLLSDGAGLTGGGFVHVWDDGAFRGSIKARLFNSDGSPVATDFAVATSSGEDNGVGNPSVAALPGGGFVVTWNQGTDGASNVEVRAQVFDASGIAAGSQIIVNSTSPAAQIDPAIAAFADGRFVVAWTDPSGLSADPDFAIRAQLFSASGEKIGEELLVNTDLKGVQFQPEVAVLGGDQFVVTWRDPSGTGDADGYSIKAQVFTIVDATLGTGRPEAIKGTPDADFLSGLGGNDKLVGKGGEDTLVGGDGNDLLVGGGGGDALQGGMGLDTASYQDAVASVVANLGRPGTNKGEATGDTYDSVERLTGGKMGDFLTGDDGANVIKGLGGNDKLVGANGDDALQGGSGNDRIGGGDGSDTLLGNAGNDRLLGGGGDDRLEGGAGKDRLSGNKGSDTFTFRSAKESPSADKGWDVIADFRHGQGDRIDLKAIDARTGKKNNAFNFIGDDAFSGRKGELRYDKGKNTFVYGDVDGDGRADLAIAFTGKIDFVQDDFIL